MADEIFVPSPAETGAFKEKTHETITVADVADLLHLSALRSNGKTEWHGPNPTGQGAKEDGFILYEEGNAWDRSIDRRYTGVNLTVFGLTVIDCDLAVLADQAIQIKSLRLKLFRCHLPAEDGFDVFTQPRVVAQ